MDNPLAIGDLHDLEGEARDERVAGLDVRSVDLDFFPSRVHAGPFAIDQHFDPGMPTERRRLVVAAVDKARHFPCRK